MRVGGGKAKGSGFERDTAKKIVKAFKDFGVEQKDCWRSVLSGGHVISAGDLWMSEKLEKLFPYVIECKFRKKVKWENILLGNEKAEEMKWVAQVLEAVTKRNGLSPLLVVKENNCSVLVLSPCKKEKLNSIRLTTGPWQWWRMEKWESFLASAVKRARKTNRTVDLEGMKT